MKKTIYLTVLLLAIVAVSISVYLIPYNFYLDVLNKGVYSDRLKLEKFNNYFYRGGEFNINIGNSNYVGNAHLWQNFHFKHFILPMPFDQPAYTFSPILEKDLHRVQLGYRVHDFNDKPLIEVEVLKRVKFIINIKDQWLFNLPIFKNYIYSTAIDKIWKDLFFKDIIVLNNNGVFPFRSYISLNKRSLKDLVYDLFILHMRKVYFPSNIKKFGYIKEKKIGVIEVTQKQMSVEQLFFLKEGIIFQLELRTHLHLEEAYFMRKLVLDNVKYKRDSVDSKISLYAKHQTMVFQDRFNQRGTMLLYSALTHDLENKRLLKELIRYMERGQAKISLLEPFYDYAFKLYGTNFSEIGFYRKENTENFLRRKALEEQEKEKANVKVEKKDVYATEEDKVKAYLERAKDSRNQDEDLDELRVED